MYQIIDTSVPYEGSYTSEMDLFRWHRFRKHCFVPPEQFQLCNSIANGSQHLLIYVDFKKSHASSPPPF